MKTEQEIKEATEKICEALKVAQEKILEAETLADEFALTFFWDMAYGMGGSYEGKGTLEGYGKGKKERTKGEWVSSSSNC